MRRSCVNVRPRVEKETEIGGLPKLAVTPAVQSRHRQGGLRDLRWKSGTGPSRSRRRSSMTLVVACGMPPHVISIKC